MEKSDNSFDLSLCSLGVAGAFILSFIADNLLTPIRSKHFYEIKEELKNEVFGIDLMDETYSFTLNILFPMILYLIATFILLFIIWKLIKSFFLYEDTKVNNILKSLLGVAIVFITFLTIKSLWLLIVLNFKLLLIFFLVGLAGVGIVTSKSGSPKIN
jgi:hypothetical protein